MSRVIFLDVDGVLNRFEKRSGKLTTHPAPFMSSPALVDLNVAQSFCAVVRKCPLVRVVVSSTWRLHATSRADFAEMARLDADLIHEDWRTVRLPQSDNQRHMEVNEWLSRHPETEAWIAMDDTDYPFPPERFIKTDSEVGLTYEQLRVAVRKLGYHLQGSHAVQIKSGWTPKERSKA